MMQYIKTNDVGVFMPDWLICRTWNPLAATSRLKWHREWNLFVKSILRCSFFPQILKRLSTWLAFGQGQRISDCHSPSSHIQDLVRPFSTPGFIRDLKQVFPKMLLTTPPPPSPRQTGTMGTFFWTLFFLLDGRYDIRHENIRSAFFQQWVYVSKIQSWGLWNGTLACLYFDIAELS